MAKVKKKDSAKGGSARPEYVKENHGPCYQFCNQNNFVTTMIYNIVQRFKSKNNRDALTIPKVSHHYNEYKDNSHDDEVSVMNYKIENTKRAAATTGTPPNSVNSSLTTTTTSVIPKNKRLLKHASSSVLVTHGTRKEQYYALKSIHLERCQSKDFIEELKNEVDILKRLDHPNIVRAIETFDYKGRLFLLLELCQGGDLYSRDPYTEKDAKHIVNCLLSAVSYMHSKGIVHRDLKFENICFADTSNISEVRIIDFGLSQKFAANEHLHDAVGTV